MHQTLKAAIVAVVIGSSIAFAQSARRDGLWEIKTEMQMEGAPMNIPPMTAQQCITPADANDPSKWTPQGRGGRGRGGQDCKMSEYKIDGNKVTWSMKCEGAQAMSGTGEIVYSADAYTGTMKMEMSGRGTVTMKYTGKRLGDCTK
jgi:hypothetical protein